MSYSNIGVVFSKATLPSDHPDLATSLNNIAAVYHGMKEYSKVLTFYERALGIRQAILPSDHPHLASSYGNIIVVYMDMRKH